MDNLKLWEIIRAKVVNEDAWIQQRVNWLLVSNGFLFAAFAAVATQGFQTPLFLLVPLIGFALGVLAFIGLRAGARAIDDTLTEWIQLAVAEESPSF